MSAFSAPALFLQKIVGTLAFPWQGALLVLVLSAGATIRQHPSVLRPFVHSAQMAAVDLSHVR